MRRVATEFATDRRASASIGGRYRVARYQCPNGHEKHVGYELGANKRNDE